VAGAGVVEDARAQIAETRAPRSAYRAQPVDTGGDRDGKRMEMEVVRKVIGHLGAWLEWRIEVSKLRLGERSAQVR
jgi:hypothetical protein